MQAEESGEEPGTPGATSPSSRAPGVPWWGGTCGQLAQGMGKPAYGQNVDDNSGGTTATFPHVHHSNGGQDLQEDAPAVDSPSVEGHSTATQPGSEENGSDDSQQTPVTGVPPPGEYMLRHPQLELGHPMVRAAYPYAEQYFGGIVAAYGPQAMMHPQLLGMQHSRMPLPSEMMEEEPVYVNAKQYHGILRRRQIRAKAELENKLVKTRKPYLHESRHQHALRRARGCGGRFLNTKTKEEMAKEAAANASNERASQSRQNNHNEEGRQGPGTDGTNLNSNTAGQNGKSQGSSYANQLFHSSAFHPLSGGCDGGENAQGNNLTSKSSQQMVVATQ